MPMPMKFFMVPPTGAPAAASCASTCSWAVRGRSETAETERQVHPGQAGIVLRAEEFPRVGGRRVVLVEQRLHPARPGRRRCSSGLESLRGAEQQPAVDDHRLAGDPAGRVRNQEGDRAGHIGRLTDAAERDRRRQRILVVLPQRLGQLGAHHPGADRIDPDSAVKVPAPVAW